MEQITSLEQMTAHVRQKAEVKRIAVACGEDPNTIDALYKAASEGFARPILTGDSEKIISLINKKVYDASLFEIVHFSDEATATKACVKMVREGKADILMKGLVGTDKFLKAVLDKEMGLLPPKAVLSYVCALELPAYHKLLFVCDTAVIPFPDIEQKKAMINYSVAMARRFGIIKPKVALISAVEKISEGIPSTMDYAVLCKMADRGQIRDCIIDGPLDVFLACDPLSMEIKGVNTSVGGDADVLIFPTLESCNSFYKGLMLFAGGELAGLIQGTTRPVAVMSRSESALSKYYCVALSCLMAD